MPDDDIAGDTSRLALNNDDRVNAAAKRLNTEARANAYVPPVRRTQDVTAEFTHASNQLQAGRLVKDDSFTLFESVGALEIMDAKMDSGFVSEGQSLDLDFDPTEDLEPEQVISIMDELSSLEIAWHHGYPLSQTLFTSLHLDRILAPNNNYPYNLCEGPNLVQSALRPYCLAIAKGCDLAIKTVTSQNFYEEEDFVTHLFGRDLAPRLQSEDALIMLEEATDWVDRQSQIPSPVRDAIIERLTFRAVILAALQQPDDSARAERSSAELWALPAESLTKIHQTHDLGTPLPEAFSSKVQRHLATSTPPRPKLDMSWSEAYAKWAQFLKDLAEAYRLTSSGVRQSPHSLQRATWSFASRQPLMYPRSVFQHILFSEGHIARETSHYDLLLTDLRDLVLAGNPLADPQNFQIEVPTHPRHRAARKMEDFMDKALEEYMNVYRMVCQNRCRIRRTFTQAIPLLDKLQSEAEKTDRELDAIVKEKLPERDDIEGNSTLYPLSAWVYYYKLQIMEWTIQLGFETDIYIPDQMSSMYGFLAELASERRSLLDKIERSLLDRMNTLTKERNSAAVAECCASQDFIKSLKGLADVTVALAEAIRRLYAMLLASKLIKRPARAYAKPQLMYEVRMKPYLTLVNGPMVPSSDDMRDYSQLDEPIETACASIDTDLLKPAKQCLAGLKKITPEQGNYMGTEDAWKKELKALETCVVAAGVAVTQIKLAYRKNGTTGLRGDLSDRLSVVIPPPGKRYHDWWVVPQVRENK